MEQLNDTKRLIIETSLRLFSEKGFNSTSVREIAREVGVRESAIYNHFKSKGEIINTIFHMYGIGKARIYIEQMMNDEKFLDDPYHFLKHIALDEILEIICNKEFNKFKRIVVMEMFCEENARYIIEREIFDQTRGLLREIFELMAKRQVIKNHDPAVLANEFLAPLGLVNLEHLIIGSEDGDEKYYKDQIESHIDFFWNAIKLD
ncbi:TetR/AcrR family transcriptional regulator [Sporosalibacterium faouarense]|uniref:TetR/AcrR family transcriptional regulator n=1 Tax=Sporosalibacterium faouarense TaxID=516123 RepID=UPI00141D2BCA|nr:TetR/AcrR family transcriptional regulator [Sporosalibacterium faouarense]MTI47445.1 TetR/AcrR family transcriptional regulator [Bacillota bacterium]